MSKQLGFTLIELVIVIIIMGILSATALPKFINLQDDAKQAAVNGLKAALESASSLTYVKAKIEGLGDAVDEELSSGIRVRYGYPYATQGNLELVLNINTTDWEMTNSAPAITFTLQSDTENMSATEIQSPDICKLIYTQAAKGERPDISISGCSD